jgi:dihydrofolate reductase
MAVSADGFIARADGGIDWLDRPNPAGDYGMAEFFKSIDTILWGRKTWEFGLSMGGTAVFGPGIRHYVFTRKPPAEPHPDVEYVSDAVGEFAGKLRAQAGKDIWLMGGAGLNASFLEAGEIDEFHLHVIPVLIGEGIPLAAAARRTVELELLDSHAYTDGVVGLRYRVRKPVTA